MPIQIQDYSKEYESKTDGDLLSLAVDPSQLTDNATQALSAELRKRGLAGEVDNFRLSENRRKQQEKNDIGRLWLSTRNGIGRQRFCKGAYYFDPSTEVEEFTTTVFILIFWLPLIPTGTYRVRRSKKSLLNRMRGIEKLPLNWEQVMQVWLVMMLGVSFVILAFRFLVSHY